jgi:hypothetical protein
MTFDDRHFKWFQLSYKCNHWGDVKFPFYYHNSKEYLGPLLLFNLFWLSARYLPCFYSSMATKWFTKSMPILPRLTWAAAGLFGTDWCPLRSASPVYNLNHFYFQSCYGRVIYCLIDHKLVNAPLISTIVGRSMYTYKVLIPASKFWLKIFRISARGSDISPARGRSLSHWLGFWRPLLAVVLLCSSTWQSLWANPLYQAGGPLVQYCGYIWVDIL